MALDFLALAGVQGERLRDEAVKGGGCKVDG